MKVLRPAHQYELANVEHVNATGQILQFIEKEPTAPGETTLRTVNDGTTNEEVLKALIDRCKTLNARVPSREGSLAITKLQEALFWFEERTRERMARAVEGTNVK